MAFCRYCMLSFMGVSGFFISCATCRAISRQAPSLSLRASTCALSPSLLTILLYSFTSPPISSFLFHAISSFNLPRFTSLIFSPMIEKDRVIRFVINKAMIPANKPAGYHASHTHSHLHYEYLPLQKPVSSTRYLNPARIFLLHHRKCCARRSFFSFR